MEFGDRLFWGIMIFLAFIFLWLGIFEKYLPLIVGCILGLVSALAFIKYGPGTRTEKGEVS